MISLWDSSSYLSTTGFAIEEKSFHFFRQLAFSIQKNIFLPHDHNEFDLIFFCVYAVEMFLSQRIFTDPLHLRASHST